MGLCSFGCEALFFFFSILTTYFFLSQLNKHLLLSQEQTTLPVQQHYSVDIAKGVNDVFDPLVTTEATEYDDISSIYC